ncbi:hypothetical protein DFH29DRAFT_1025125 [Suillus ampliporus]|nr:hypothetical protein DFH29DRAFT_1025125 [Suillus ampliporus]
MRHSVVVHGGNRAARTFFHQDVAVTLNSAFSLLQPPLEPSPDSLDAHRRKWGITLESTVFSSAPDLAILPQPLRESLLLSPQSFISTLYVWSLTLFTPSSLSRKSTSVFLPHQVLTTLVASTLKIDCPDIGRDITEEWLSKRGQYDFVPSTGEPYHKVLELYCLDVLPRLGEWEYVREFLSYENELSSDKKHELYLALEAQHARAQESTRRETPKPEISPSPIQIPPPRSPSPSPASSSSSLSTTSTRTAVPASPHPLATATIKTCPEQVQAQVAFVPPASLAFYQSTIVLPLCSPQHILHSSGLISNTISQLTE